MTKFNKRLIKYATNFNLFDEVTVGDKQIISSNANDGIVIELNNVKYTSNNAPTKVEIEENGPLRSVIKVKGQFKDNNGNVLYPRMGIEEYDSNTEYAYKTAVRGRTKIGDTIYQRINSDIYETSVNPTDPEHGADSSDPYWSVCSQSNCGHLKIDEFDENTSYYYVPATKVQCQYIKFNNKIYRRYDNAPENGIISNISPDENSDFWEELPDFGDDPITYTVRFNVYKDKSYVKVDYTLENENKGWGWSIQYRTHSIYINSNYIKTSLNGLDNNKTVSFDGYSDDYTSGNYELLQTEDSDGSTKSYDFNYAVKNNGTQVSSGEKYDSYADLKDSEKGLMVSSRWFWQSHPKSIEINDDVLNFNLLPDTGEKHRILGGSWKTHQMIYNFHNEDTGFDDDLAVLKKRLIARASDKYYARTNFLAPLAPEEINTDYTFGAGESLKEAVDTYNKKHLAKYNSDYITNGGNSFEDLRDGRKVRHGGDQVYASWYGWDRYGSTWAEYSGSNSQHYDWTYIGLMGFLRFNEQKMFDMGEEFASHKADMIIIHNPGETLTHGGQRYEDDGLFTLRNDWQYQSAPTKASHFWTKGVTLQYLLTGEERYKDAITQSFDHISVVKDEINMKGAEIRNQTRGIDALVNGYKLTGKKQYIEDAFYIFENHLINGEFRDANGGSWISLFAEYSDLSKTDFTDLNFNGQIIDQGSIDALWGSLASNGYIRNTSEDNIRFKFLDVKSGDDLVLDEPFNSDAVFKQAVYEVIYDKVDKHLWVGYTGYMSEHLIKLCYELECAGMTIESERVKEFLLRWADFIRDSFYGNWKDVAPGTYRNNDTEYFPYSVRQAWHPGRDWTFENDPNDDSDDDGHDALISYSMKYADILAFKYRETGDIQWLNLARNVFKDCAIYGTYAIQRDNGQGTPASGWRDVPTSPRKIAGFNVNWAYMKSGMQISKPMYYLQAEWLESLENIQPADADFKADRIKTTLAIPVKFTDLSANNEVIKWEWDFDNDGTIDSHERSPQRLYAAQGTYNVSLKVTDADGNTDIKTKTDHISVVDSFCLSSDNFEMFDENIWTGLDIPNENNGSQRIEDVENDGENDLIITDFGTTIFRESDDFRFIYQEIEIEKDFEVELAVNYVSTASSYSKAGLMIRDNTDSNAANALVYVNNIGYIAFSNRVNVKESTNSITKPNEFLNDHNNPRPEWGKIKLTKQGNKITAYYYDSSESELVEIGNNTVNFTDETILVGIASAAYNSGKEGESSVDDFVVSNDVKCDAVPINHPVADFTYKANETNSLTIEFTDNSQNAETYSWDMDNDEEEDYDDQHPTHTYAEAGTYPVTLTVTNSEGAEVSKTTDVVITEGCADVTTGTWGQPEIIGVPSAGVANRAIGGEVKTDITMKSVSIYLGGTGNVRLAVYAGGYLDDPSTADLLWDAEEVPVNGTQWYTIEHPNDGVAVDANTVVWLALKKNEGVIYYYSEDVADAGDFYTGGRNKSDFGVDTTEAFRDVYGNHNGFADYWYSFYINYEMQDCSPVADFTADPITGAAPLTVNFTNTSQNAVAYSWDFGDGTPVSTENRSMTL